MPIPNDPDPKLAQYAHPEKLVTTAWLADHLDDPNLVVVESDEDILLYETGHIPGAVKVDWHTELNDSITRDYLDAERFAQDPDVHHRRAQTQRAQPVPHIAELAPLGVQGADENDLLTHGPER